MTTINTDHLSQCIKTLDSSLTHLQSADPESIEYEVFRNATIKGFELTLEISGKLLRKALKAYIGNPRAIDEITFNDWTLDKLRSGSYEPVTETEPARFRSI